MYKPNSLLEGELFKNIEAKTPDYIKNLKLIDMNNPNEFTFTLKREHLESFNAQSNPEGLGLKEWFANYAKEAKVSTAGIRGPQNILYPQDTRFPINLVGITLATLAKAMVATEKYPNKKIVKIAGREVRYNSKNFLEAIARIQAGCNITTLVSENEQTIPIWLASFLAFKLDLIGGEYITSSHGISVKNATKDLNSQGSQYLPEESMEFVNKIQEIFGEVEKNGSYIIKFSSKNDKRINQDVLKKLDDGIGLYIDYLKSGVANKETIKLINTNLNKIVIDNVGGSAYRTLGRVLKNLGIESHFDWLHIEEDPFFHGIGKYEKMKDGKPEFYDYSVDATVAVEKDGQTHFPVIESMDYAQTLKNYPIGTPILITDPDHDRLTIVQKDDIKHLDEYTQQGIESVVLDSETILAVFSANQSFLMLMNFWANQLKAQNLWNNHPRFIIKTTASARSWDEWAMKNGVKVVNVPVGFKEIANIIKKVELQIKTSPDKPVIVQDVLGEDINLGINPRMLFAGEESGGMIIGTEELVTSLHGRQAMAMREKSATEAIIVASALIAELKDETIAHHFLRVLDENKIISKFDTRVDIAYYNESEPDIEKLKADKLLGETKRTKNDLFYLSMAIAVREGLMTVEDVRKVLQDAFSELDFSNLQAIKFVGDGTYLEFSDKCIEIRPSGTDAKTKAYGSGLYKKDIQNYANILGYYSGDITQLHRKFITNEFYENSKDKAQEYYLKFVNKGANNEAFVLPDYTELFQ